MFLRVLMIQLLYIASRAKEPEKNVQRAKGTAGLGIEKRELELGAVMSFSPYSYLRECGGPSLCTHLCPSLSRVLPLLGWLCGCYSRCGLQMSSSSNIRMLAQRANYRPYYTPAESESLGLGS